MFKVDDYVMYGSVGACQITDIQRDESEYYILHPVFNDNMTIKIPVRSENLLRPILAKDDVLVLIASIPEKEPILVHDERQKSNMLKAALKTGNNAELVRVIKTLYLEKEAKAAANKTLCKANEDIMLAAEKMLYEEFALALGISPEEVLPYIQKMLPSAGK